MTQFPYAGLTGEPPEPAPQRTSVLAIISLVLAIVSVVPLFCIFLGSGALAVIFGGAALLFINRERGRLSGTGLAATGIVIGLLVTVIQIAGVMIASRAAQFVRSNIVGPIDTSLAALDKGDLSAARKVFTPAADSAVSDEALTAFVAAYKSRLGAYKGMPDSLLDLLSAYGRVGQGLQSAQGRNDTLPFPVRFEKGDALVMIVIDQQAAQSGRAGAGVNAALPVRNIGIVTADGKTDWLLDPGAAPGPMQIRVGPGGTIQVEGPKTKQKPDQAPPAAGEGSGPN